MSVKTVEQLVEQLTTADSAYAEGFPIMSDEEYDALVMLLKMRDPKNAYFKGVGAPVRGAKTQLPKLMGSLDQVYDNDLVEIVRKYQLHNELFIATAKLDGASLLLEYVHGNFTRALTRGDGYEGQDVTEIIKHVPSLPKTIDRTNLPNPTYIRAEAIYTEEKFAELNAAGKLGRTYKNARNYVAGQLNRQVLEEGSIFAEHLHIVTYQVFGNFSKDHQISLLRDWGFEVARSIVCNAGQLDHEGLERILRELKSNSPYALDGVVIDVDDVHARYRLEEADDRGSINPNFQWKFKINDNRTTTTVAEVEWNISKSGYLKPRIRVEPIDLVGVTITYATGFNAKFIEANGIGPGAVVQITRSGDVIPFIEKVVTRVIPQMPSTEEFGELVWTENRVDLKLTKDHDDAKVARLIDFFAALDVAQMRQGSVLKLYDAGFTTAESIINASLNDLTTVLGANGSKAYESIISKLNPVSIALLAGSSQMFGRGIGRRKFAKLFEAHGTVMNLTLAQIVGTEGFDTKSAEKIIEGYPAFDAFLAAIEGKYSIKVEGNIEGPLTGIGVCFTGVRDKALEDAITSKGGRIDASVSKKTTHLVCKDPNSGSAKLVKAAKQGVTIISLENARKEWQ